MQRTRNRTRTITMTGLFAAIATVLMYFEFPVPFMPPFLKMDLSSVPILIGAFLFGPFQAMVMAFIKASIHALSTQTGGVGELADFIITTSFAVSAGLIYKHKRTWTGAALACVAGVVAISIAGMVANKFLLIPFYANIMPIDAIVSACNAINPMIDSINTYILFGALPFNLIKGILISLVTFVFYKRLSALINNEHGLSTQHPAKKPV